MKVHCNVHNTKLSVVHRMKRKKGKRFVVQSVPLNMQTQLRIVKTLSAIKMFLFLLLHYLENVNYMMCTQHTHQSETHLCALSFRVPLQFFSVYGIYCKRFFSTEKLTQSDKTEVSNPATKNATSHFSEDVEKMQDTLRHSCS